MASQKFQKLRDMFVSVGAAVVIFGAWAKILHLSFADVMLTVGLLTEAAIVSINEESQPQEQNIPGMF